MKTKLALIRGRSYKGRGVSATAKNPFVFAENTAVVDYLVNKIKRFEVVVEAEGAGAGDNKPPAGKPYPDGEPTADWKVDQLRAYAEERDIDLTGVPNVKVDIVAKINEAEGAGTGVPNFDV